MKEQILLKIALISGIIGIIILFLISDNLDINESAIEKINKEDVGADVKLTGKVSRITQLDNVAFIELEQPATITVILFKDKNISLYKGDDVEIIGEIDEYNGELEVIAQRIRIIGSHQDS